MARLAPSVTAILVFVCVHGAPGVVEKDAHHNQPDSSNVNIVISENQAEVYNAIVSSRYCTDSEYNKENDDINIEEHIKNIDTAYDDNTSQSDDKSPGQGITNKVRPNENHANKTQCEITSKRNTIDDKAGKTDESLYPVLRTQLSDKIVIEIKYHNNDETYKSRKNADENLHYNKATPDNVNQRYKSTVFNTKSNQIDTKRDDTNLNHPNHDHTDKTLYYHEKRNYQDKESNNNSVKHDDESSNMDTSRNNSFLHLKSADTKDENKNSKSNNDDNKNSIVIPSITHIHTKVLDHNYHNNDTSHIHGNENSNEDDDNGGTGYRTPDNDIPSQSNNKSNDKPFTSRNVKKGSSFWPVFSGFHDSTDSEDYTYGKSDQSNHESNESNESRGQDYMSHEQDYRSSDNTNKSSIAKDKIIDQKSKGYQDPYLKIISDDKKTDEKQNNSAFSEKQTKLTIKPLPYWIVVGQTDTITDRSAIDTHTSNTKSCNSSNCYSNQDSQHSNFGKAINVEYRSRNKKYYHKEDISYSDRHHHRSDKRKEHNYKQKRTKYHTKDKEGKQYGLIEKTKKVFNNGIEQLKNLLSISDSKNYKIDDSQYQDGTDRGTKHNYWHGKDGKPNNIHKYSYHRRTGDHNYKYKNKGGRRHYKENNNNHLYEKKFKDDDRNKGNKIYRKNKDHNEDYKGDRRDDNQYHSGDNQYWKHKGYQDGDNDRSHDHKRQSNDGDRRDWKHTNDKRENKDNDHGHDTHDRSNNHKFNNNDENNRDWKNKDHLYRDDKGDHHVNDGYFKHNNYHAEDRHGRDYQNSNFEGRRPWQH